MGVSKRLKQKHELLNGIYHVALSVVIMEKLGEVKRKLFSPGSKSEHVAVYLQTEKGEFVLRRQGGNAFKDDVLDNLIGKKIRCEGVEHNYTFIISNWEEI